MPSTMTTPLMISTDTMDTIPATAVKRMMVAAVINMPCVGEIAPSVEYETVKKGSTGLWVSKLQEALGIQVDGKFGRGTNTALKKWQKENGLEPDGIAGRNTYRSLSLLA